jgi:hypothetical protein
MPIEAPTNRLPQAHEPGATPAKATSPPSVAPIPPARAGADKRGLAPAMPAVDRGDGSAPPGTAPSVLIPAEMSAVIVAHCRRGDGADHHNGWFGRG